MVLSRCCSVFKFLVSPAHWVRHLMVFIMCTYALQSWNGYSATANVSYVFGCSETKYNNITTQHRPLLAQLSAEERVQLISRASPLRFHHQRSLQSSPGIGVSRTAKTDGGYQEQALTPDSRVPFQAGFQGLLDLDGSISSVKLITERDQFEDDNLVLEEISTWPINDVENGAAGGRSRATVSESLQHWIWKAKRKNPVLTYPPCPEAMRDFIPCSNTTGHRRHCPEINKEDKKCAISAPANYARQFQWPTSRNQVRGPNVPNVPFLKKYHQQQQKWWMPQGRGSTINVDDTDPRFPNGTNRYVLDLAAKLADVRFGEKTRLALDVGCGIGNVAAALETLGVLTLSIAGESSADNGVQLVAERGYPALVQSFLGYRLPYPGQAFDLVHCAACDVKWEEDAGLNLKEADRILRAGGYFLWMGQSKGQTTRIRAVEATKRLCWTSVLNWGQVTVWQKPINNSCGSTLSLSACNRSHVPENSGKFTSQSCFPESSAIAYSWPTRLSTPPRRLEQTPAAGMESAKAEVYVADLNYWKRVVNEYAMDFGPIRVREIRNVLDMNAAYGGFGAAVALNRNLQWWVLNVVPVHEPDRLAVIFDRGLLGLYHDWCKSLEVYPRTFDMVHSVGLFSSAIRCEMRQILHEMDRILRPGGFAIIREQIDVLLKIQNLARALHWKALIEETGSGPKGKNKVLNCQKTFWRPKLGKK